VVAGWVAAVEEEVGVAEGGEPVDKGWVLGKDGEAGEGLAVVVDGERRGARRVEVFGHEEVAVCPTVSAMSS
jgi:hypothetical protein